MSPIVTEIKNSSYLPIVDQFDVDSKTSGVQPSGCVPTAGAIAIAYYAKNLNCTALWDGKTLPTGTYLYNNTRFREIVLDLRSRLGMTDNSASTNKLPEAVAGYMKSKGFTSVGIKEDCKKEYSGKSWCSQDFVELERALHRSNPVFLAYYEDEDAEGWHSAVVYKSEIQRDWAGNFKECTYHINTGWSSPSTKNVTTWNDDIRYFVTLDVN